MTTSTQRQNRRGTATQCDGMTPAVGEGVVDTTNNRLRIGDGARAGGWPVPNFKDIQNNAFTYATTAGSGAAFTLALAIAPAAYAAGQFFQFKADRNGSGSDTLNVNGLGAVAMKKMTGGALAATAVGDIIQNGIYLAAYNATGPCVQILSLIDTASSLSVGQGDLSTSTGTVSSNSTTLTHVTLPGGEYGFFPQIKMSSTDSVIWLVNGFGEGTNNYAGFTSYTAKLGFKVPNAAYTLSGQQRYITASPPFDPFGLGHAGGFIFLLLNKAGDVVSHYAADVPPWAYNGPTQIRAHRVCPITGKKYRRAMKTRSLDEIMQGAPIKYVRQLITQKIKNADMGLIPHPFGSVPPEHSVVLLDVMDDRLPDLIEYQNAGGGADIAEAIRCGKLYADNEPMKGRPAPNGVLHAALRFKYTK